MSDDNINSLVSLWESATPAQRASGTAWYPEARRFCENIARKSGVPLPTVCFATSALSPQLSWPKNQLAIEMLVSGKNPTKKAGALPKSVIKARKVLSGARFDCPRCPKRLHGSLEPFCPAHAPKTHCFARNILEPNDSAYVTIDRHAATAFFGTLMRKERFDYWPVAGAYMAAAHKVGAVPSTFQATIWTVIRDRFAYWHENRDGMADVYGEAVMNQMGLFSDNSTTSEVPF